MIAQTDLIKIITEVPRKNTVRTSRVYILVDVSTDIWEIRYVGKTVQPLEKYFYGGHILGAKNNGKRHVQRWLRDINFQAKIFGIGVYPTEELAFAAERYYIDLFRKAGCRLTNETDGGEGTLGHHSLMSDVSKANMSRSRKEWFRTHEHPMKRKKHSDQSRQNMSLGHLGYITPKQQRDKLSLALSGKPKAPEHTQKVVEGLKRYYKNHRHPLFNKHKTAMQVEKMCIAQQVRRAYARMMHAFDCAV